MIEIKVKLSDFNGESSSEVQTAIQAYFNQHLKKEDPSVVEILIDPAGSDNNDASVLALLLQELNKYTRCKKIVNNCGNKIELGF